MDQLTELTDSLFWTNPDASYIKILHKTKSLFKNPYSSGLVATKYHIIEAIARHPAMGAADRQKRGRTINDFTARLLSGHPNFANGFEHEKSRRKTFQLLSKPGIKELQAAALYFAKDQSAKLIYGEHDLVGEYTTVVASQIWSYLATGNPDHAKFLAKSSRPIAKLMAFVTTAEDLQKANEGSAALLEWAVRYTPDDEQGLIAALTFDAIDGAAGLASNAIWMMLNNPKVQEQLKNNRNLIENFIQEVARLHPPVLGLERGVKETVVIEGHRLEVGTNILLLNAVANRDPSTFENPHKLQLHAPMPRNLSFGLGMRSCAGRMLSRLVCEATILALLDDNREITLTDHVSWGPPGQLKTAQSLICQVR